MAKGKKTGGRDFEPGNNANPKGSPGLPQELKNARKLNQVELERIVNHYLYHAPAQLEEALARSETPMIERIVASIMLAAATDADHHRLEWVLQRMLGKVKDQLEVSCPVPFVIRRPGGETVEIGAKEKEDE